MSVLNPADRRCNESGDWPCHEAICDTIHSTMKNSGFDQYYDEAVEEAVGG